MQFIVKRLKSTYSSTGTSVDVAVSDPGEMFFEDVVITERKQRVLVMLQNGAINKDYRVKQEIFTLLGEGFDVSLICPSSPDGVEWKHDGVKTYYFTPAPDSKGPLSYFYEYQYSLRQIIKLSWRVYRDTGFDIIHACNPPDFFFLLAMFCKPVGKKFIYDQHDLAPELYLSRFSKPSRLLFRILMLMEFLSYRFADAVIVTNNSYREIAIERGRKNPSKVGVVRNGPYYDGTVIANFNKDLKRGRKYMACYIGEVSPQDGAEYMVLAAHHLIDVRGRSDVTFNIVGSGASLDSLKQMVRKFGIDDYVFFPGWISDPATLYEYLVTADVCISPEPRNPLNDHSSFIKVMDYMAAEKPIVAFDLKETKLSAGDGALYAIPNDKSDFADKIELLLDSPELRKRLGRVGRARIDDGLDWAHSKASLVELYQRASGLRSGADYNLRREVKKEKGRVRLLGVLFKKTMKRLGSGAPNNYLRVLAFRLAGYQIGRDVWIGIGLVVVDDREGEQTLSVGDRAAIAPRATIILQSYPNNSRIREAAPTRNASVKVGNDAWIGACAIILPGVSIGAASVVGAGSVVTKDVPEDSVFVGNPARCLRAGVDASNFKKDIGMQYDKTPDNGADGNRRLQVIEAIDSMDPIDGIDAINAIDKAEGGSAA